MPRCIVIIDDDPNYREVILPENVMAAIAHAGQQDLISIVKYGSVAEVHKKIRSLASQNEIVCVVMDVGLNNADERLNGTYLANYLKTLLIKNIIFVSSGDRPRSLGPNEPFVDKGEAVKKGELTAEVEKFLR